MTRWLLPMGALVLLACDGGTTADAGGPDTGAADGGGSDGGSSSADFTYVVRVREGDAFGADVGPLAGARVVVDTDLDRYTAVTDAEGAVSIDAASTDGHFDVVVAADGFVVDADVRRAVAELGAEGETMTLLPLDTASPVSLRVDATGVPSGGRWCMSPGGWIMQCTGAGVITMALPERWAEELTAFAIDADGAVVEAVTGTLADGEPRTATVTFDGTSELPITSRDVRLQLPTDPASPFADHGILVDHFGWLTAVDTDRNLVRGFVTNVVEIDGNAITATFWEARADGEALLYANAAYPADHDRGTVRVLHWYPDAPPADMTILDVPRPLSEGMPLDAEVSWTPVAGADFYAIVVEVEDRIVMRARSATAALRLPALPDGYDGSAVFPPGEAWAVMRPVAIAGTLPTGADQAVDGQLARGPAFSLSR